MSNLTLFQRLRSTWENKSRPIYYPLFVMNGDKIDLKDGRTFTITRARSFQSADEIEREGLAALGSPTLTEQQSA